MERDTGWVKNEEAEALKERWYLSAANRARRISDQSSLANQQRDATRCSKHYRY